MGDFPPGRVARPAVRDFFRTFADYLDTHFEERRHPKKEERWLDFYLERESELHRGGGTNVDGITEKDVRLMMAIYLWEVYYLIKNNSPKEPVMAAYNFVTSTVFRRWNRSRSVPVNLNGGIFETVSSVLTLSGQSGFLLSDDHRVIKFKKAVQSIEEIATPQAVSSFDESDLESDYDDSLAFLSVSNGDETEVDLDDSGTSGDPGETGGRSLPFLDSLDDAARSIFVKMCNLVASADSGLFIDTLLMMYVRIHSEIYPAVNVQTLFKLILTDFQKQYEFPYENTERIVSIIEKIRKERGNADFSEQQSEESTALQVFTREVLEECVRIEAYLAEPARTLADPEGLELFYGNKFEIYSDEFQQKFVQSVLGFMMTKQTEDQLTKLDKTTSWKNTAAKVGIALYGAAAVGYMISRFSDSDSIGSIDRPEAAAPVDDTPFDPAGAQYPRTEKDHLDAYLSAGTKNLLISVVNFLTKDIQRPYEYDPYNYINSEGHLEFQSHKKRWRRRRRRRPRPTFFDHTLTL